MQSILKIKSNKYFCIVKKIELICKPHFIITDILLGLKI